jgi:tetratricopeptide (TPR) repeat protein
LSDLGVVSKSQNDFADAANHLQQGLAIYRTLGHQVGIAFALINLGEVAFLEEQYSQAQEYFKEGSERCSRIGRLLEGASALTSWGRVCLKLNDHDEAAAKFHEALEIATTIDAVPRQLEALLGIAHLEAAEGNPEEALALLGLIQNHPTVDSAIKTLAEVLVDELKSELSEETISAGLDYGRSLDLSRVIQNVQNEESLFSLDSGDTPA